MQGTAVDHVAIVHDGADDLAARIADPLRDALDRGESVFVCLPPPTWTRLAARIGPAADRAIAMAPGERYARPGVAMAELHHFVDEALASGAGAAWSVGRVPLDGTPDDARWWRYEAAVDVVLADRPLHALCTFDRSEVEPAHVDAACRTHAWVDHGAGREASPSYRPAGAEGSAASPPHETPGLDLLPDTVAEVRLAARTRWGASLSAERLDDLLLVASEIVANAVRHGRPPVTVRAWDRPDEIVVEVADGGDGVADVYADLRRRQGGTHGGFGLWLVGQLAHRLDIGRADGRTVVTAALRR